VLRKEKNKSQKVKTISLDGKELQSVYELQVSDSSGMHMKIVNAVSMSEAVLNMERNGYKVISALLHEEE